MSHRTPLALVLAAALLSGGCGTLDNIKRPAVAPPHNPDAQVCRIYGGVRNDWAIISEYPWDRTTATLDYVCIPLLAACDLFFVGIGDTLTLPYTAFEEVRRAFYQPNAPTNYAPTPVVVPDRVPATAPTPQPATTSHVGR